MSITMQHNLFCVDVPLLFPGPKFSLQMESPKKPGFHLSRNLVGILQVVKANKHLLKTSVLQDKENNYR